MIKGPLLMLKTKSTLTRAIKVPQANFLTVHTIFNIYYYSEKIQ